MTEQNFQAPPSPPKAPSIETVRGSSFPVTEIPADNFAAALNLPITVFKTKIMVGILSGAVLFGLLIGMLFGGGSAPVQQMSGLQGVIMNPDAGQLPRCGVVSETAPCAAYFVNHSRNDRLAESFFDTAQLQTGRAKFLISMENAHYAKTRIPPGHIVQIRIPAMR